MKNLHKHLFICLLILSSALFFQKNSLALIYPYNNIYEGSQEVPPSGSSGTGNISGTFDDATKIITVSLSFSGLTGNTTAAHFHSPAPIGVNGPVVINFVPAGFPLGVTSGTFSSSFTLTPVLEASFLAGTFYANIHTNINPGGEIRAQITPDNPLPVELASFTSYVLRNTVTLKWTTTSETNNAGFDIERSSSSNEWSAVGHVAGNGNSAVANNYEYSDRGLAMGVYSYRLKQTDFNGNFEYFALSNEVNIGVPLEYSISQNYPNPFNPSTKIDYDMPGDGNVNIVLFDISGREVATLVNEFKTAGY
ncbi:MAG: CHRD domain-containing protein, partial [Ignavibacteria bacterium]